METQGGDEVNVLDALRVRLLQHLLDNQLPCVRPLHRREREGEVVEGDGEPHAGEEQLMQRLHVHRLQQRPLYRHVRVGQRLDRSGRVDHPRPLRQLLIVKTIPRVEHHRGTTLLQNGRETGSAQCSSLRSESSQLSAVSFCLIKPDASASHDTLAYSNSCFRLLSRSRVAVACTMQATNGPD